MKIFFVLSAALSVSLCQNSPCPADKNGEFPDPINCRKYWRCDNGAGTRLSCPGNLLFAVTADHMYCDYPENVCCDDRQKCDDSDQNCEDWCPATEPPRPVCDNFECPNNDAEGGNFPEYKCSPNICECTFGIPYKVPCKPGLIFNPDAGVCDYCYNVFGCENSPACTFN